MSTVIITQAPAGEPVSLAQAKAVCRVDQGFEDDLISGLITAARLRVEQALGLCLLNTGISEWRDAWGPAGGGGPRGGLSLARGPLVSVTGVSIADSQRLFRPLDPGAYAPLPGSWPGEVGAGALAVIQPTAASAGLRIDYVAGFGATADLVPQSLKQAVLALVAWSHAHPGEAETPITPAEPWLSAWRRFRI